jgi:Fe(3+) dicitrate transport protein
MKYTYLPTLLLLLAQSLFAQTGMVKGKIMEINNVTALPGVTIYIEDTNFGSASNGNGNYLIKDVPAGNYTLIVSAIGYFTLRENITVEENKTSVANFTMTESISTLSEVTVMTSGSAGIKEIPGSVYYISPKAIEKFSYTDINRTLRAVPGVNLQEEDGFGLRPNIGLRGTGTERSSKITIMEDGVLMAPAPYAAPAAYYFPTIGRMQAVEILKGSSQIKYGPYTTGGAINLISTQIPNEFSGRINLLAGSYGGKNLHAFVGNSHKNVAYVVETYQYGSDGFKQLDGGGSTGFDKKDYLAKVRINTNEDAKVYQSLLFKIGQVNEISNETYLGLTQEDFNITPYRRYFGSQVDQMKTEQTQLSLTHTARFSDFFNVTTTAYTTKLARNWYKLNKVRDSTGTKSSIGDILDNPNDYNDAFDILKGISSTNDDALFVKANNRTYYSKGIQTVLGFNFKTNRITHNIDFGLRLHQDQMDRFQWVDEYAMDNGVMELTKLGTPGTESNRIESAKAFATYVQYKLEIGNFTAIPGLRYENMTLSKQDFGKSDPDRTGIDLKERSNQVEVFIPGIGLDYKFNRYWSTFAGIHKGFSPAGSKEGTEPEKSINYELGTRLSKTSLSGEAVVFINDYSNLLGTDLAAAGGGGTTDLFNGGEVLTKGLEFQLTYDLLGPNPSTPFRLPLSIVYTYTDSEFQNNFKSDNESWGQVSAGDEFPYLANNQVTFILGAEHQKFNINLSGRYIDEMRTVPGQGTIPENEKTEAYFVIDASANYAVHNNISLFTNATNLTNKAYLVARRPAGLRPGMPRAFNIGIKANF